MAAPKLHHPPPQLLFRVFPHETDVNGPWAVCAINLEGEPAGIHSEHAELDDALYEASRANYRFQEED